MIALGAPKPYHAYVPLPFTKPERGHVTIVFGGTHWRFERILEGVFKNLGYRAKALPPARSQDLRKGRELGDIGQCCPMTFVTGNLVNFLVDESRRTGRDAALRDYVYLTAGSCGPCRFGQYHENYALALRNAGLDAFRIFLLAPNGLDQGAVPGGGLEFDMSLTLGAVWAILCSDVLQDLEYQIRPYEVFPGATEKAVKAAVEELFEVFQQRPLQGKKWSAFAWHATTRYFVNALKQARRHFEAIKVDRLRIKPKVKITGEFYLQTVEGSPNYNIHRWLESEGAEVYPAAITPWLDYAIRFHAQPLEERVGINRYARIELGTLKILSWLLRRSYNRVRNVLMGIPHRLPNQYELRRLAAPYFHHRLAAGEGDTLIGKALWVHLNRKAHMICELSPYGCMPNTMSVGAMSAVLGEHPDLLYAPLEIKGDSEVHALSRCQMILTEAKRRAQHEYERALERGGLTTEKARRLVEAHPEMKRALYHVPHLGAAGTAANLVLALSRRRL